MASSFLGFSLLFLSLNAADGFKNYAASYCEFNSSEMKDIEYILSFYYNKDEYLRYSSSVGEFVGYTELGVKNAERLNRDTAQLAALRAQKERVCKNNIEKWDSGILAKKVPPSDVTLSSVTPPGGKHTHMLMCSVYGFYPKHISVKWLRDGKVTTSDVTSTEELADGDWYYQIHSHLEFTPRSGEKVSCMVEHISLSEPVIRDWDPSLPESERNKIAIGASGLILGLILSLAGFIYYKRKMKGRILVPTN
ncbi:H-2 class II histocompatibility antigen, E-S beta chain-like isoform X1 [Myripristis murdjan]|uniref:H-2 class II histocompatibility antigen, E-S beta chain-like isoform X1 n=1 Tax=Myripristis murdjan TaxID=586833 RepID=UPI0011762C08|nr:H-2 class II histocompatibility antigen, E-S beta chain-like isoform X1 [Myripristis murdjan]